MWISSLPNNLDDDIKHHQPPQKTNTFITSRYQWRRKLSSTPHRNPLDLWISRKRNARAQTVFFHHHETGRVSSEMEILRTTRGVFSCQGFFSVRGGFSKVNSRFFAVCGLGIQRKWELPNLAGFGDPSLLVLGENVQTSFCEQRWATKNRILAMDRLSLYDHGLPQFS